METFIADHDRQLRTHNEPQLAAYGMIHGCSQVTVLMLTPVHHTSGVKVVPDQCMLN